MIVGTSLRISDRCRLLGYEQPGEWFGQVGAVHLVADHPEVGEHGLVEGSAVFRGQRLTPHPSLPSVSHKIYHMWRTDSLRPPLHWALSVTT